MTWSLRTRLTLSYVLVALLCVLMVSVLANGVLESSFRRYVRESQARQVQQVVTQIGTQRTAGGWDDAGITAIGMSALEQGMIVKVADRDGRTVWDATVHNNGLCVQMITHMAQNMASRYPNWRGSYTENVYPVRSGFADVGVVTVGFYGPFFLNDQELAFINSLNILLLWVTLAAMALAVLIGFISARRITVPLARVAAATRQHCQRPQGCPHQRNYPGTRAGWHCLLGERPFARTGRAGGPAPAPHGGHGARAADPPCHAAESSRGADRRRVEARCGPARRAARGNPENQPPRGALEQLAVYEGDAAGLNRRVTDVGALVAGIVRNHEPQFREKGIALRFAPMNPARANGGPALVVDADKLSQAIINLLSNALKYTPGGGSVDVGCRKPGRDGTAIRVSRHRDRHPREDLPRVFERFYRADNSRSRATGGAGIGFSIARAIVEAHGGTITASSEPGRGSRFVMRLPPSGPTAEDRGASTGRTA